MNALPVRSLITGAVAAVAITGAAGCADPEPVEWPDDPAPEDAAAPAAAADPAEAEATAELITLLNEFREAEVEAYANPQPPPLAKRELSSYLADPMLGEVLATLNTMRTAGIAFEGEPASEPIVVEVQLDARPPAATVRDCVDATDWNSVFQDTGDPVPGEELPERYVMEFEATLYPEHGWLFRDFVIEEDAQC